MVETQAVETTVRERGGVAPALWADVDAVTDRGEKMKLFQLSWLLGISSYVLFGVLRRSVPRVEEMAPGVNGFPLFLLAMVLAGVGTVLGFMSWSRKEVKAWWVIVIIVLNITMVLTGILFLLPG